MDSGVVLHLLILAAGVLTGLWWSRRTRRERWQRLTTDLQRELPGALRAAVPQLPPEAFPIGEEIASWRHEIDTAARASLDLERQVAAKEGELALRTDARDRAVASVSGRARELADLECRNAVADAAHTVDSDQLEQMRRAAKDQEKLLNDLVRKFDIAELAANEGDRLVVRASSRRSDLNNQLNVLAHRLEEEQRLKVQRGAEVERLRQTVDHLRGRVEGLRPGHAAAAAEVAERTSLLDQATARRDALHGHIGELARRSGEAQRRASSARDLADALQAQRDPQHVAFQRETQDLAEHRAAFDRAAPARDQLLREEAQLQAELTKLTAEVATQEATARDATHVLLAATDEMRQLTLDQAEVDKQSTIETSRTASLENACNKQSRDLKRCEDRLASVEMRQQHAGGPRDEHKAGAQETLESLSATVTRKREIVRRVETRELDLNTEIDRLRRQCVGGSEASARERASIDPLRLQLAQAQQVVADRTHEFEILRQREGALRASERSWDQKIANVESTLTDRQIALRAAVARVQELRRQLELAEAELIGRRGEVAVGEARVSVRQRGEDPARDPSGSTGGPT